MQYFTWVNKQSTYIHDNYYQYASINFHLKKSHQSSFYFIKQMTQLLFKKLFFHRWNFLVKQRNILMGPASTYGNNNFHQSSLYWIKNLKFHQSSFYLR